MRILKVQMLRDAQRLVEIVSVYVNEDSGVSHHQGTLRKIDLYLEYSTISGV